MEVAPGVFQGRKPQTPEDFEVLRRDRIRTVLSLETLYSHNHKERKLARRHGFLYRNIPIAPDVFQPSERHVRQALETVHDPSLHPIFVHCLVGSDRATFISALYRLYYLGWSPEAAWREMLAEGFHDNWWLHGLKKYFWRHTEIPDWARKKPSERTESQVNSKSAMKADSKEAERWVRKIGAEK